MDNDSIMTILMAIGAGLSGAVTVLFKVVMKQSEKQVELSQKVGHLEGKQSGISQLSEQVLQAVHDAANRKEKDFDA